MLRIKLIIKYCVSCWITDILRNDTRSIQYQINKKAFFEQYLDRQNELLLMTNPNNFRLDYRIKCILY